MKIITAPVLTKPRQAMQSFCFSLFVFLSVNHSKFCFIRSFGGILLTAIIQSFAAQKIGAAYRLHPFPISLHKALYGVLTAQSNFPILLCHWFQLHTFYGKTAPFPCMPLSLYPSPVLSLSMILSLLGCTRDKKGVYSPSCTFFLICCNQLCKGILD